MGVIGKKTLGKTPESLKKYPARMAVMCFSGRVMKKTSYEINFIFRVRLLCEVLMHGISLLS